jgi:hypothetical protein
MQTESIHNLPEYAELRFHLLTDYQEECITGGFNGVMLSYFTNRPRSVSPPQAAAQSAVAPVSAPATSSQPNQSFFFLNNVNIYQINYVFNLIFGNGNSIMNFLGNQVPIG